MANVTKESIGNLHDKLTVKVSKEDYYPSFEKAIKDYSKKANIPGFRKGMVPTGMVKKMYGASIFYDEVIKAVEKEIQEYLTKEKPVIFAQPLPMESDMRNLDMSNPTDYEFPFEIGLKPEVSVDVLSKAKPYLYKVKVTNEMVDEEIEKLVTKHGNMKDAETVTGPENVLNVLFEESDAEGNPLPEALSKDNSILVKYFAEDFRPHLYGKSKDESVVLQLKNAFPEKEREWILSDLGLDKNDSSSGEKYFKMTITKIGLVEKKQLNEDFFSLIFPGKEIKTEEAFREAMKEELQQQWDAASKSQMHDQLYHILLETRLALPDEFLKRWIAIGGEKKKTPEEVEAEYPSFTNQLKWTLISDKIISENKIDVSEEELRNYMKEEVMRYFGQMNMGDNSEWIDSYIDRMMKDEKQVDSSYRKILTEKLFNFIETQVTPEEKQSSPEELLAMQHHHHH
ncbi:trigger factor [Ginsengibacter hankyongi]|uniref:Trigger factor n=1 Tax=Ginsengibacter hankyongi TaxID=2607284 RepID=A0A5J5IKS0_9BACT|nr:trigger factor [Ginsengibacter hankyongi]KAA9041600.1 trigger factor [Ginsengibacter hankyongi]